MTPTSPIIRIPEPGSPTVTITPLQLNPAPHATMTTTTLVPEMEGVRLRSNTLPPPKSPGHHGGLSNEAGSSWSPVKGAWLLGGLEEEESPYDRLEAKDTYIPSSDSSIATSPSQSSHITLSSHTTHSLQDTPTPPLPTDTPLYDDFVAVTRDGSISPEDQTTKKSKKRKKFWPFRKKKSGDKGKGRSQSEAQEAKVIMDTTPAKSRAFSEAIGLGDPIGMRVRRSYTLLTGHITAKYAARQARERVAEIKTRVVIARTVERIDTKPPANMSPVTFKRSLFCEQLKFKLRSALQNMTSAQPLDPDIDMREHLILLTQQSLQRSRWQQDNMELSLLTELLTVLQQLPNTL